MRINQREKIQKTMPIVNKCYDSFCTLKQSWGFEVMESAIQSMVIHKQSFLTVLLVRVF